MFPATPVDHPTDTTIVTMDRDSVEKSNRNSNNIKQNINEFNDCERNVIFRRFSVSEVKMTLNWTTDEIDNTVLSNDNKFVNFR